MSMDVVGSMFALMGAVKVSKFEISTAKIKLMHHDWANDACVVEVITVEDCVLDVLEGNVF